ncbi:hypothetical protein [Allocoleopsis franciscana]|uniref:Uncharacterized protein n=1 Tax=Allocoleopsis franciscana PCC 7113 TaxID=1173027 RepID=K9WLQ8_9CYAN|nr:hypothetical protein [Allocoleopsis franciscana]AFZ20472.1 hypothetical protein Mic7113_4802 [Allocoleopsis franciscana PCC 7113]
MATLLPNLGIVEQNKSKLILKHQHGILINLFIIVWALGFSGIPLGMIVLIASEFGVTTLSCQRVEPKLIDCVWSKSQYLGFVPKVSNQPIQQVTDAKLESAEWSNGKGGGTAKVWVSLITKSSKTRLFETQYAIESGFKPTFQPEVAQKIKTFINSQATLFKIEEDTRLSGSFLGGLILFLPFTLIGALVLYASVRSRTIILDKTRNLYIRQIHTVLGTQTQTYTLSEIKSVEVMNYVDSDHWQWYQLMIVLQSNKKYKFPGMINYNRVQEVANQLQNFIGLLY